MAAQITKSEEVKRLVRAMSEKHIALYQHAINVATLAHAVAHASGLVKIYSKTDIFLSSMFHDIGRLKFPDELFTKRKRDFTDEDKRDYFSEPIWAAEYLEGTRKLKKYARLALMCHEQPEGDGYPSGLTLKEIDGLTSIVSVACRFSTAVEDAALRGEVGTPFFIGARLRKDIILFFGDAALQVERALLETKNMNSQYWDVWLKLTEKQT